MTWVLILGARSEIAQALAHHFGEAGFSLYLAGRNLEELERDAANLQIRYEIQTQILAVDILDQDQFREIFDSLDPKPEIAICAVGYLGNSLRSWTDANEAAKIMHTNLNGCIAALNPIAAHMEQCGKGSIIGISSVAGDRGRASTGIYGAAKAGFSAYLSGLGNRLAKKNVQVLNAKPGFVRTRMTEGLPFPALLTATPQRVAKDIFKAWKKGKSTLYTPWFWRWIMLAIKNLPDFVFMKLKI